MKSRSAAKDEPETIGYRLLAAAISVPIFELSLYLGFYAATGSRSSAQLFFLLPFWLHALYVGCAVVVGLIFGFNGITWLLGHLFLTHFAGEQDKKVTYALWGGLLFLALLGYLCSSRL